MKLKKGDDIVCVNEMEGLTFGKVYNIIYERPRCPKSSDGGDICILCDEGSKWWFGQADNDEPWTNWFVTKQQWIQSIREDKLNQLL